MYIEYKKQEKMQAAQSRKLVDVSTYHQTGNAWYASTMFKKTTDYHTLIHGF